MPNRNRVSPKPRQGDLWLTPLPHPSWAGEPAVDLARPLAPGDFWQRLGL